MFDGIGFMELLIIAVLALIVLGPERLPTAVRSISRTLGSIKRMASSVKSELESELKLEQLHSDLKKAENKGLKDLSPDLQNSLDELKSAAQSVNRPYQESSDTPASASPAPAGSASVSDTPAASDAKAESTGDAKSKES
ncbi:Sec-independent protein translocase protein TatB [Paraferrimonas sedimenticola]|uniref:Sec-independent protein translocase protein TatB n=1 Tax=Paraferrimonas sedimenticola TaxID=375674 RepID=A0AA37W2B4_9GAMM|nr:Sec-independent protein translocase protein TatB [Paraferrimonas sedimenticola]GLP97438.1 Sec-independent protein translocase protein TatB [Paraferrimonas sedimenticola]